MKSSTIQLGHQDWILRHHGTADSSEVECVEPSLRSGICMSMSRCRTVLQTVIVVIADSVGHVHTRAMR